MSLALRRALALWLCFALGKVWLVAFRGAAGAAWATPWALPALLGEDAMAAAVVGLWLWLHAGSRWIVWPVSVFLIALNVPAARLLSSPLTPALLGTAGGALSDSIAAQFSPSNIAAFCCVLIVSPLLLAAGERPWPRGVVASGWIVAGLCAALHPHSLAKVDTQSVHRNPVAALLGIQPTWSRAPHAGVALTPSPHESVDLSSWRGAARGSHVLWVVLESTAARFLTPYGASPDPMPTLTDLSRRSLIFDRAWAVYPESIKGLYSHLCSQTPAPHTTADRYDKRHRPAPCLPETMSRHGYRTGLFHSGRFAYLGMRHVVADRGWDVLKDAEDIGGKHAVSFGTDDRDTARSVLDFVDEGSGNTPFFAVYMPIAGHHPYRSPGDYLRPFPAASERDDYLNDLYGGDDALRLLIDGLKARGVFDQTLVVVFGDHGEAFGEHPGNFAHSLFVYEPNLHVPLLFKIPGMEESKHAPQPALLTDVAPTTLALLGIDAPQKWSGQSRLAGLPRVQHAFSDHSMDRVAVLHGPWKLVSERQTGRRWLFHLALDPAETTDLGQTQPLLSESLEAEAWRWWGEISGD